jgi:hypothetical protein
MTGPDTRMDEGANPLPVKCPHCTMVDLDFVSKPYLLTRGFTAPPETAPAEVGNFLVRDRVRKILEQVVPGACTFVATAEKKSKKPTDWWLAVPANLVDVPGLPHRSDDKQACRVCGEPKLGYYPWQEIKGKPGERRYIGFDRRDCDGLDVFKRKQWYAIDTVENFYANAIKYTPKGQTPPPWSNFGGRRGISEPPHPQRWTRVNLGRNLFFSARLDQLLKQAKVKGQLIRSWNFKDVAMSPDDQEWVAEKLEVLASVGLTEAKSAAKSGAKPTSKPSKGAAGGGAWFRTYLKKHAAKKPAKADFAAVEKKQKLTLPQDYKDFIQTVGPKSFDDVMGIEGFTAEVLPPAKLDFKSYRRAKWKKMSVESDVDGFAIAETEHGDVFVIDVADPGGPVFWYDHEQNVVEPFADNFAACVQRFARRN